MLRLDLGNKSSGSGFNSSTDMAHLKPCGRKPSRNSHWWSRKGAREAMDSNRGATSGRSLCSGCDPVCSCPGEGKQGRAPGKLGPPSPSALGTSSCRARPARHTARGCGAKSPARSSSAAQGPRGSHTRPQSPLRPLSPTAELSQPPFLLQNPGRKRNVFNWGPSQNLNNAGERKGRLSQTPALSRPCYDSRQASSRP